MSPFSCAHLILFFGADGLLAKNASNLSVIKSARMRKLAAWHHQKRSLYFAPT
jgi:hypothetical protein